MASTAGLVRPAAVDRCLAVVCRRYRPRSPLDRPLPLSCTPDLSLPTRSACTCTTKSNAGNMAMLARGRDARQTPTHRSQGRARLPERCAQTDRPAPGTAFPFMTPIPRFFGIICFEPSDAFLRSTIEPYSTLFLTIAEPFRSSGARSYLQQISGRNVSRFLTS